MPREPDDGSIDNSDLTPIADRIVERAKALAKDRHGELREDIVVTADELRRIILEELSE